MATSISRAKLIVDTAEAERNLAKVGKSVDNVGSSLNDLKAIIGGIAIGKFITDSLNLAARLDTLGQATGIATANLRGFQLAVGQSGGNSERATDAISDLVKNIGEAANGSAELTKAFGKVGVSLDDLDKTSSQGILDKVVVGLAGIDDKATRSALQMKLMGEAVKTVDFRSVAAGYGAFTGQSSGYAAAAESARKAQDKMVESLDKLQQVVVEAFKPINDLVTTINVSTDGIRRFVQALIGIAVAAASIAIVGRLVAAFRILYVAVLEIASGAKNLFELFRNLVTGFGSIVRATEGAGSVFHRLWLVVREVGVAIAELAGPAFTALKTIAGPILIAVAGYWSSIQDSTSAALRTLQEYANILSFGLIDAPGGAAGRGNGQAELEQRRKDAAEQLKELNRSQEAAAKLRNELAKQAGAYSLINAEHNRYTDKLRVSMGFQVGIIGLTKDQVELETKLREEAERYQDVVQGIKDKQQRLRISLIGEKDPEKAALVNAEIAKLSGTLKIVSDQHLKNRGIIESQTTALQAARKEEENRLFVREQIVKSLQDENAQQQKLGDTLRGINQQIGDLDFAANLGKGSKLEQQIEIIKKNAVDAARAAGNEFAGTFQDNGFLTEDESQRMSAGLKQIADGYDAIASKQIAALTKSRETMTGLQSAVSEYVDKATNDAQIMADSFDNFVGGMEDAFANFVTTGKLDFKSLANSIIADLARIAVKKAIVAAIGGPLGSLFGFANGGPVQGATPIVVGERGPELFVPKAAGTIISNGALKGGASSGSSQPQQTVVNYNIQAVDAASFRSLVARDPSFIYAVTEQGRRSQPAARRIA